MLVPMGEGIHGEAHAFAWPPLPIPVSHEARIALPVALPFHHGRDHSLDVPRGWVALFSDASAKHGDVGLFPESVRISAEKL